jgi:TolB-like protein
LGVENLLEGSVRTSGDQIRVTVQLIRAADSTHLWSETYERPLKDIFQTVRDQTAKALMALRAAQQAGWRNGWLYCCDIDRRYRRLLTRERPAR